MKKSVDPLFEEGLRLFARKEFFECHEVIEALWLRTDARDPHRDLYKGVIQAAAALYQRGRGIESGARGLFRTAVGYLEKYEPEALGLDVTAFIGELKTHFKDTRGHS
ncbi:MAG: DUF309 domain-containing protein [Candidatus Omnitrophica bacterium]|nr:DUF309 domain-containing protein [Candidatus Omnitrophota bacterium]